MNWYDLPLEERRRRFLKSRRYRKVRDFERRCCRCHFIFEKERGKQLTKRMWMCNKDIAIMNRWYPKSKIKITRLFDK